MKKTKPPYKHKKSTIIVEGGDKPRSARSAHYVDNDAFYQEMKIWKLAIAEAKKNGKPKPRMPEPVGAAILKIAKGLGQKINFVTKPYVEEMISDAIENCLMYASNFDHRKYKNPFSYFTQVCYYAFLRRIGKEKKQIYLKYKMLLDTVVRGDGSSLEEHDVAGDSAAHSKDNMEIDVSKMKDFIVDFEKKNFGEVAKRGAIGRRKRLKVSENNLDTLI